MAPAGASATELLLRRQPTRSRLSIPHCSALWWRRQGPAGCCPAAAVSLMNNKLGRRRWADIHQGIWLEPAGSPWLRQNPSPRPKFRDHPSLSCVPNTPRLRSWRVSISHSQQAPARSTRPGHPSTGSVFQPDGALSPASGTRCSLFFARGNQSSIVCTTWLGIT